MSNSHGAVKFADGTIKYIEYYGTVDVCKPHLRDTMQEVQDNWRKTPTKFTCRNIVEHMIEYVEVAVEYGGGSYWKGKACRICNLLVSGLAPDYDSDYHDGLPDWYPNKKEIEEYFK